MGLDRFIKRQIPIIHTIDTIKNIVDEGSVKDGIKRTVKEDYCEDNPITSNIYKAGKYDGKIEGYNEASKVYEAKLIEQADAFLKQKKLAKEQIHAYESLLDEYKKEIDVLEDKFNRNQEENEYLQQLLLKERQLKKLKVS